VVIPRGENVIALISRTAQEGYDHALLAERVARENVGVYHFISSSALEGSIEEVQEATKWIEGKDTPALNGFHHDETPSDHLVTLYEAASLSLLKITRRPQRAFVDHHEGSSRLIINFLPITLDSQNVLDISLAHPLPRDKIRHAVRGAGEIVVVEAGEGKFGASWASVEDALEGLDYDIRSVLVGSPSSVTSELQPALEGKSIISRIGVNSKATSIPTNSVTVPTAESNYTNLLTTSPSPLEILNDPSQLAANESTSPLYAFGKAVAIRRERARLVELAKSVLKASNTSHELHQSLGAWLLVRDDAGSPSADAGKKVEGALSSASSAEEKELLELGSKGHWAKKNLWIVISNSWANDLASSGLHHALASGLDINLLVYETAPSPFSTLSPPQPSRERKKDLALYALNMGDVYVSSVAVYADYAGVINAMRESEAYSGPGLVLAYLPWGEKEDGESVGQGEVAGPLERLRETKRAVAGGWWPMFRWNPTAEDGKQFTLDSPAIKTALSEFLDRQSHLSQLSRATPAFDPSLTSSVGNDLVSARKEKARKAYDALVNSLDGPGLLVLYGSDGGAAEKTAKKLVSRAKMRGVGATMGILDGIAGAIIERLREEKNVVIITSTAGQGEFPQNAREFWKTISKTPESEIQILIENEVKFAVFGMGDSHYWPRPEDAGYYNKSSKDLYNKLSSFKVPELLPLGLGDDSDPDGYMTGYKPWESNLWKALGVDAVEVEEVVEETVANEHIKIASDYLRGTILEGLADKSTGAIGASDAQLTKFHGTYMQVSTCLLFYSPTDATREMLRSVLICLNRMIEISEIPLRLKA
jgi:sulfite reductase (NADPH) hemoprotein beta-component